MTDTPRDARDRLGEALRALNLEDWGYAPRPWGAEKDETKHRYRAMADDFLALAASCGLKIVPDDGEMKVKDEIPADLADALRRLGKVEWGEVGPKADAEHVGDFAATLALTRRDHGLGDGPLSLHGVYAAGTGKVLCHTGTSPNSAAHARLIVGAWNHLVDLVGQPAPGRPVMSDLLKVSRARERKLKLYWFQEGRCYWCSCVMTTKSTRKHMPATLATLDHLDDRLAPDRGQHGGEFRVVLACNACNNRRGRERVQALPKEELWRRSGRAPLGREAGDV